MPRRRSAEPRYRRRVVLELTPDESTILDGLADRHGTIRGAVLAGLRGLEADRSADLEARVGALSEQLATAEHNAQLERNRAAADLATLTEQLVASRQALKAAQAQTKEFAADRREAKAKLANETAARRSAAQARQAAEGLIVHHAFCAACDKLVPEAEWAEQPWRNGFATFHKAHGFREKNGGGLLRQPASVLFWRARSRAGDQA
jgi:hypothetical protein